MFEVLHPILEWLSTEQGRGMNGWGKVILAIFGFLGVLTANELRAKKKALKNRILNLLSEVHLVAEIYSDAVGVTHANLERTSTGYRLTIISPASGKSENNFNSIGEVECFLNDSTAFKLPDFVRVAGKT